MDRTFQGSGYLRSENQENLQIISVNGEQGVWLNKHEDENWTGEIPLSQYPINEDADPEIITRKSDHFLLNEQEISVRYLRPISPPSHGDIIIKEEKSIFPDPAPPLIIRQQPPRPITPPPIVIREAPPKPPANTERKLITIPGKVLPAPPRKVFIERIPQLPAKPPAIIIERWLPYKEQKRRVVFYQNKEPDPVVEKQRNVIIEWETPNVTIKKEYKNLGIVRTDPYEYISMYRDEVKSTIDLPVEFTVPNDVSLASKSQSSPVFELEGDIEALKLVDLDREGLSVYKRYFEEPISRPESISNTQNFEASLSLDQSTDEIIEPVKIPLDTTFLNYFLANSFAALDNNGDLKIRRKEGIKLFKRLNKALKLNNSKDEIRAFICNFKRDDDGFIDFHDFKNGIIRELIAHEEELQQKGEKFEQPRHDFFEQETEVSSLEPSSIHKTFLSDSELSAMFSQSVSRQPSSHQIEADFDAESFQKPISGINHRQSFVEY
jgi:Ca2+-binding EF-hand superfamily protein